MIKDDIDLVEKAIQGEREAFEGLVRKYQDAVYGLAFHITGNFTEAQDVAQQAFVTAYMKLPQLKEPGKFIHWLKRITANECVAWHRQRQRMQQFQGNMENFNATVSTPDQELEEKELEIAVQKAMESLSKKNRLAISLYYIDGLTQREVGSFLGIPTSTVGNRISRARKQLKEEMINMVEDVFDSNKLPENFMQKVRNAMDKAQEAKNKGDFDDALVYSDEALDALDKAPESSEAMGLRKDVLWLKGDTFRSKLGWRGGKEILKYHEQALKIEEESGDKRSYAESLLRISPDYIYIDKGDKEIECKQKAINVYKEIGDLYKEAETSIWTGAALAMEKPKEALPYFRQALDFLNQIEKDNLGYSSVCRAAIHMLEEATNIPMVVFSATSEVLEKTPGKLVYIDRPNFNSQPGVIRSRARERDPLEAPIMENLCDIMMVYTIADDEKIIFDYALQVGDEKMANNSTRVIESDSETVTTEAGEFSNCLKIKDAINHDAKDKFDTRQVWFAPGVGPVKIALDRADGIHLETELAEYFVRNGDNDYYPISLGNIWMYNCTSFDKRYIVRDYCKVGAQQGDVYYVDHGLYAYFRGSKEEYDANYDPIPLEEIRRRKLEDGN